MKRFVGVALVAAIVVTPAMAEEPSGQDVFDRHCSHCHADNDEAPGTLQLARRRGEDKAVLTERDDLVPAYIEVVVRNGLNSMPPFVPSDLDADKLEALIEYLTD